MMPWELKKSTFLVEYLSFWSVIGSEYFIGKYFQFYCTFAKLHGPNDLKLTDVQKTSTCSTTVV